MGYSEIAVDLGLAIASGILFVFCCVGSITCTLCIFHRRRLQNRLQTRERDDSGEALV
jgi:tellurite resistance protein TehA-like permease